MNVKNPVVVVTGASSGTGAAAARQLRSGGAEVVVVGRDPTRTHALADELGVRAVTADFTSLASVRRLAEDLLAVNPRIDVLLDNAGAAVPASRPTVDGNEPNYQVNALAPFLLITLLTPALEQAGGRVVTTTSETHRKARLTANGVSAELDNTEPGVMGRYALGKLAALLLHHEHARHHPGLVMAAVHDGGAGSVHLRRPLALPSHPRQGAGPTDPAADYPAVLRQRPERVRPERQHRPQPSHRHALGTRRLSRGHLRFRATEDEMTPPRWSRAVVGLLGAVVVALGVLCFAAPTALFGPDSYRIPVRVSIGLLGAVAGGLGVAALLAAATGTSDTLRTMSSALLVVTTIAPAVVLYNIGYFDTVATSGVRALSLSLGIVLGAGVPLILNLRVLHRLRSQPAGSMEQEPALRHADEVDQPVREAHRS
jgi:NAD(P)-dependent dehydrogenase (short-subunit alcohol dehydrogenase family)